jgi:nucleotide-binding universal stress UspA family protein
MLNFKHILFPLDFSSRCCAAVPYVEALAARSGARVTMLSVAQPFFYAGMGDPGGPVMVDTDEIQRELQERLDSALVKEFAHITVDRVADLGDPAQEIVSYATANDVDLIMMPTHGYGPFRGLLLGSVTAKVLHDAVCPVWTAAHMENPPARAHLATRAVLCAVDGTDKSVELMKYAAGVAAVYGATLRVAHVIPGIESWPAHQIDREFEEQMRLEARRTIEGLQKAAGVEAPLCVAIGGIAEGVREEARRHGSDLIVIGRGVLNETLGRLRTHAYGIIRQSPCPVISE